MVRVLLSQVAKESNPGPSCHDVDYFRMLVFHIFHVIHMPYLYINSLNVWFFIENNSFSKLHDRHKQDFLQGSLIGLLKNFASVPVSVCR